MVLADSTSSANLPFASTSRFASPSREELPGKALTIRLFRAVPLKFKCADLNARATEVGIEELHLAHERLSIISP